MYIWVGCKLPETFAQEIRNRCLEENRQIGLDTVAFLLPQHVSLKISFWTEMDAQVIEDLTAYLSSQKPFTLRIRNAEQAGQILWLPVAENEVLQRLHAELDARLEEGFGIRQHAFDKQFLFHSTLFLDTDTEKIARMQDALAAYPMERELAVDTFLLGCSESGKAGTYRVIREIKAMG